MQLVHMGMHCLQTEPVVCLKFLFLINLALFFTKLNYYDKKSFMCEDSESMGIKALMAFSVRFEQQYL